jgi:hypothetical protein
VSKKTKISVIKEQRRKKTSMPIKLIGLDLSKKLASIVSFVIFAT